MTESGVTALWLNPWYDNTDRPDEKEVYDGQTTTGYHGYGAIDFYSVDEHLGDLATLRELVDKAHALGIKIVQDQVANHTGPYHPWVKESPTPTWYNGTEDHHINETWQTWTLKDQHATPNVTRIRRANECGQSITGSASRSRPCPARKCWTSKLRSAFCA